nr:hypothetical protein [Micromonospora sp. DSM 115978]
RRATGRMHVRRIEDCAAVHNDTRPRRKSTVGRHDDVGAIDREPGQAAQAGSGQPGEKDRRPHRLDNAPDPLLAG